MASKKASVRFIATVLGAGSAALALFGSSAATAADPIESFYKGKTVRILVGYSAGGGYDMYGRVFAEYIGKFIPGHPTVVVQNMPGAGSFVAAKNLYNVVPKDGTYFGIVSQTLALDAAMNEDPAQFDVTKMPYIGRLLDNVNVGAARPGAPFNSFEDARRSQIVVGATGGASPGFLVPTALAKYAGAKFKIVSGYGGSSDVYLAAERGEVDLIGSIGLTFVMQRSPDWIKEHKAPILYQIALKRHPLIPDTPSIAELGINDEATGVLRAIAASSDVGYSILTTPAMPAERLAAMRQAFQTMMADPAFLAAMEHREIPLFAATGEEMDAVTREVMKTPKRILELTKALIESKS